jgi:serine/threonine protein kinase/CRP-like cAMP-binding protein
MDIALPAATTPPRQTSPAAAADDEDDVVDAEALTEADWCIYHRLPDIIQELAFNLVIDRPEDIDRYARGWLLDLKRQMIMNGNSTCAQGINLAGVVAERGLHFGGDPVTGVPGILIVEPHVQTRSDDKAKEALAKRARKAARKTTMRVTKKTGVGLPKGLKGLGEKHKELIEKIARLRPEDLGDIAKHVDAALARRDGSEASPSAGQGVPQSGDAAHHLKATAANVNRSRNRVFGDLAMLSMDVNPLAVTSDALPLSGGSTPSTAFLAPPAALQLAAGGSANSSAPSPPPATRSIEQSPSIAAIAPQGFAGSLNAAGYQQSGSIGPAGGRGRRRIAVSAAPIAQDSMTLDGDKSAIDDLPIVPKSEAELTNLREAMRACTAFNNFEPKELEKIIGVMHREAFPAATEILVQGQPGRETFYLVIDGTIEIIKNGKFVTKMGRGNYFGELELMYMTGGCAATVKTVTNVELYALTKDTYQHLLLRQTMALRAKNLQLIDQVEFFSDLSPYNKLVLAEAFNRKTYPDGDMLIRRGEAGEYMHIILDGEVSVVGREEGTGKPFEIVRRGVGDVIGELEFLFNHTAVADVVAVGMVLSARLGRKHFESAIGKTADVLAAQISKGGYENYLKNADEKVKKQIATSTRRAINSASVRRPDSAGGGAITFIPDEELDQGALSRRAHSEVYGAGTPLYESTYRNNSDAALTRSSDMEPTHSSATLRPGSPKGARGVMDPPAHPNGEVVFGTADGQLMYRFSLDPFQDDNICLVGMQEDGTILHWSEGMIRATGYSVSDVLGRPVFTLLTDQENQRMCFELITAATEWAGDWDGFQDAGAHKRVPVSFTQASQMSKTTLLATCVPSLVRQADDRPNVVLLVGHELKKKPPVRTVEFAPWFLDVFTPGFRDSLRMTLDALNPMNLFQGILPTPSELQAMRESWTQCGHVVDQFEPLARVDASALIDNWQPVNVETLFRRLQTNLAAEIAQRHNNLYIDIDDVLVGSEVFLDVRKLPEVLTYLITHANKQHIGMTITVSAHCRRAAAPRSKRETGPNMTADELAAKHETAKGGAHYVAPATSSAAQPQPGQKTVDLIEFTVRDNSGAHAGAAVPSTSAETSGLQREHSAGSFTRASGLPNALRSTQAMGGKLTFETTHGDTVAMIQLPLVEADAKAGKQDQSSATYTTILVEGDTVQRNYFCQYLWGRKHAVLPAHSWKDVLALLESSPVDILIIDPEAITEDDIRASMADPTTSNPLELLRQYTTKTVVILTSESFEDDTVESYLMEGVLALAKPCSAPRLHLVVDKAEQQIFKIREESAKITQLRKTFDQTNRGAWKKGKLLGKGAFGEVFEAIDVLTQGKMAVKIMKNTADTKALMDEIQTMTTLQHENIIHYFYCEENKTEERDEIDIFMELAVGGELQDRVKASGATGLPKESLTKYLREILAGIVYIHDQGYVHCDIKSANVLMDGEDRCKLGDFGTAKRLAAGQKLYETRGTPLYMAPEVWNASEELDADGNKHGFDQSADIWSLGCMVMEMATGKSPFAHLGTPVTVMNRISSLAGSEDLPDLSPLFKLDVQVFEFIRACLEVKPESRPKARDLLLMPLLTESSDTSAALKVLQKAELMHYLLKFVAFQSPPASDDDDDVEFFRKLGTKTGGTDAFFDSDEEDDDDDDDDDDGDEDDDRGNVQKRRDEDDDDDDDDDGIFAKPTAAAPQRGVPMFQPISQVPDESENASPRSRKHVSFANASMRRKLAANTMASSKSGSSSSAGIVSSELRHVASLRREVNPFHVPRRAPVVTMVGWSAPDEVDLNGDDD